MRIVIIGNGILALGSALLMAESISIKDEIIIVGRSEKLGSATNAAPAMLNSFAEIETDALSDEFELAKFNISRESTREWPNFVSIINNKENDLNKINIGKGTYIINNTSTDSLEDENFNSIVSALKKYNEEFEYVNSSGIQGYKPKANFRSNNSIYLKNEGFVNSHLLINKIENILIKNDRIKFLNYNASKINVVSHQIHNIELDNGDLIEGDEYLLALGASTGSLIENSNLDIDIQKIFYGTGISFLLDAPECDQIECIRTPNRGLACGVYSAPRLEDERKVIAIGTSNYISVTPQQNPKLGSVTSLMRSAIDQINQDLYRADLLKINIGWRPISQDTYPIIGRCSIENMIIASGTRRDGFHNVPILSKIISEIIINKKSDKLVEKFHPERQLIKNLSRKQGIDKAIKHIISGNYQHGYSSPDNRMNDDLEEMYKNKLNKLYDELNIYDWGIPPEMIDMYRYGHAKVTN